MTSITFPASFCIGSYFQCAWSNLDTIEVEDLDVVCVHTHRGGPFKVIGVEPEEIEGAMYDYQRYLATKFAPLEHKTLVDEDGNITYFWGEDEPADIKSPEPAKEPEPAEPPPVAQEAVPAEEEAPQEPTY